MEPTGWTSEKVSLIETFYRMPYLILKVTYAFYEKKKKKKRTNNSDNQRRVKLPKPVGKDSE